MNKQARKKKSDKKAGRMEEKEKLFDFLQEHASDGWWDWDLKTNEEYLSPRFKAMFGYQDFELPNSVAAWQKLIFPEDLEVALRNFKRHAEDPNQPYHQVVRYRHKNGKTVWVICRGAIIERDKNGKPLRMVGTHTDITALKEAEQKAYDADKRFRELAENINEVFYLHTKSGEKLLYVSPAYEKIWGRRLDAIYKNHWEWVNAIHPRHRNRVIKSWRKNCAQGTFREEYEIVRPNGTTRWILDRAFPVHDESGKTYRIAGIAEDITDRKRIQEVRVKSRLISVVSHELRTPLHSIDEGISIVLDGETGNINPEQREMLAITKRNVERLSRLINNVLDFQKLEAGAMNFHWETGNLNELIDEVYESMRPVARNKGLSFTLRKVNHAVNVKMDRDKLLQVLVNLVNNAIKFTEQGSITLSSMVRENQVEIEIADTGVGIRKEDLPKLFVVFGQIDRRGTNVDQGTGLGLFLSKKIVQKHHGSLTVNSVYKSGSRFHVYLPINQDTRSAFKNTSTILAPEDTPDSALL